MDGCLGYSYDTQNGIEYDCKYEFSGDIDCGDCIFGSHGGTQDPRLRECDICGEKFNADELKPCDGQLICDQCFDSY